LGSWAFERWFPHRGDSPFLDKIVFVLAASIILTDQFSAFALDRSLGTTVLARIALTLVLIAPPAFLMGFCFPMGMRLIQDGNDPRASWYWAINGAFSVIGSVVAMVTSFSAGLSATLWMGTTLYLATGLVFHKLSKSKSQMC
jgi:hypothetical protein